MGNFFFILGVGRSGTTLLQSMMNAHPEIAFSPETHFLKHTIVPSLSGHKDPLKDREEALKRIKANPGFQNSDVPLGNLVDEAIEESANHPSIPFFRNFLRKYAEHRQKQHAGDKDPMNAEYVPHIKAVFPEAYVIHLIRDPRDVLLSRVRSGWGAKRPALAHVCEQKVHLKKALEDGPKEFGKRYIEVFYEDLIRNPGEELKKLCDRLGLEYDPSMLHFQEKAADIVDKDEKDWKRNVFKPVQKDNTGKWRNELSTGKVKLVESAMMREMDALGYEREYTGYGPTRLWSGLPLWLCYQAYRAKIWKQQVKEKVEWPG